VAALLRELTPADLTRILAIVEPTPVAGIDAQAEQLLQAAVTAAAQHDSGAALHQLQQLVTLDPSRAAQVAFEPGLSSIRPAVERLMIQMSGSAKLHAEARLAEASHRWDTQVVKEAREVHPETLILVANRLLEAGGLSNYVRSAAISGYLIDEARWVPAFQAADSVAEQAHRIGDWSLRRLIPAWFALGFVAECLCWWLQYDRVQAVFEVWAGGLLVLGCLFIWQRFRLP
jgi:hypothetical protein